LSNAGRSAKSPKISWIGSARLATEGRKALLLVWDNAAWLNRQRVRASIWAHNRRVKREGGVRIVVCALPTKSPWREPDRALLDPR
jgi:ribosomal protein L16/L10AE